MHRGNTRYGFKAELGSYGQAAELSSRLSVLLKEYDGVQVLANAVAEELAVEHCSFYGDKTFKVAKGFLFNATVTGIELDLKVDEPPDGGNEFIPMVIGEKPDQKIGAGSQFATPPGTRRR